MKTITEGNAEGRVGEQWRYGIYQVIGQEKKMDPVLFKRLVFRWYNGREFQRNRLVLLLNLNCISMMCRFHCNFGIIKNVAAGFKIKLCEK